jgi:segregation and condensation protein B
MELEKLDKILEAILFVSGEGVNISDIMEKLELQRSEIDAAAERLKKKYYASCGIHILSYNDKLQFCTNPAYAEIVATVLNPIKEKELSRSSLEVAAIVAYKQPVTRLEVEQVRGVNSDYAIQMLVKHNIIGVVGRKEAIGRPLLFGTTDEFLKRFQLSALSELPDYETLIERIKVLDNEGGGKSEDNMLFDRFELPDEEIPDFLKEESNLQKVETEK